MRVTFEKAAGWTLGAVRSRLVGLRPRVDTHPFSRFDGFPRIERRRGGHVSIGRRVRIFPSVRFTLEGPEAHIAIGERSFINRGTEIVAAESVRIGVDCAISWDVCITDTDFHRLDGEPHIKPVLIGDHVWIGMGVLILKGVTVGEGAVIAARSVVTANVPPRTLVAGNPARVIRENVRWEL